MYKTWSIAKWQGNRFWYDHPKVRILLLQILNTVYCLQMKILTYFG